MFYKHICLANRYDLELVIILPHLYYIYEAVFSYRIYVLKVLYRRITDIWIKL